MSVEGGDPASISGVIDAAGGEDVIKIILLGDSACGKSKLVERFLMKDYQPRMLSTYALTLFRYNGPTTDESGKEVEVAVDFWDTAGQERFASMHPAYYHQAHACILCFDVTRKETYKSMPNWVKELREYRTRIPTICVANKVDVDMKVIGKEFAFPKKHNMQLFYCSAADGTNVVAAFQAAISAAYQYKTSQSDDFVDQVLALVNETDSLEVGGAPGADAGE